MENFTSNLNQELKIFKFVFITIWKTSKLKYILMLMGIIVGFITPMLTVIFPKYFFTALEENKYKMAIIYSIGLASMIFLSSVINTLKNSLNGLNDDHLKFDLNILLNKIMIKTHYEELESSKFLNNYELAKKCIDSSHLSEYLNQFTRILFSFMTLIGVSYILASIKWQMYLIFALVLVVNIIAEVKRGKFNYENYENETPIERNLYYVISKLMRKEYAKEIRLFKLQSFLKKKMTYYTNAFHKENIIKTKKNIRTQWWVHGISGFETFIVYIYATIIFMSGSITIGEYTTLILAVTQFSSSSVDITKAIVNIGNNSRYVRNLKTLFNMEEKPVKDNEGLKVSTIHTIEFDNVSFKYSGQDNYALKDINIILDSNKKYSIVGENGAGKTTFVKLMMGLYTPTSGRILFNGHDISNFNNKDYINNFSTVFQDFQTLSLTIAENITMNKNIDIDLVNFCLEKVGLSEKVKTLSNGINTYITQYYDESGVEISGGELQKLAIARALYKDAPIYVFDEPTSALSPQSEYELYEKFHNMTSGKTVFFISHRLSSCKICDEILVFTKGNICERGNHIELMKNKALYSEMFNLQSQYYRESI